MIRSTFYGYYIHHHFRTNTKLLEKVVSLSNPWYMSVSNLLTHKELYNYFVDADSQNFVPWAVRHAALP